MVTLCLMTCSVLIPVCLSFLSLFLWFACVLICVFFFCFWLNLMQFHSISDLMEWSQPAMRGPIPSPRAGHTANVVVLHRKPKIVVFCGGGQNGPVNDLHLLDIGTLF